MQRRLFPFAKVVVLLATGRIAAQAQSTDFVPVTDAMLQEPAAGD